MKFDIDRFAKLAGLPADRAEAAPSATRPAPASRNVMTESQSRRTPAKIQESAEIKQLRAIIRKETVAVLNQMNESKMAVKDSQIVRTQKAKSLNEAITMGFYGPGFGNNKSFVLGGPMTSASRFASLSEADEMDEAAEDEEGTLGEADEMDESPNQEDDDYDEDEQSMMRGGG